MRLIAFTVPGNPLSQNRAYRVITIRGRGSLGMTPAAKKWKRAIAEAAHAALEGLPKWDGPTRVDLVVAYDSMRPDIDGPIKLALDALQGFSDKRGQPRAGGCIVNDRQVRDLRVTRRLDRTEPSLTVVVQTLDAA